MTAQYASVLADLVGVAPDQIAVRDDRRVVRWQDLDERSHQVARGLELLGLAPGDHVGLIATNRAEFVEALIGAIRGGFTITPVKTNWTAVEITQLLTDAGSRAVITDTATGHRAATDLGLRVIDLADWDRFLADHDGEPVEAGRRGVRIPYTSGTTGAPKGVERLGPVPTFEEWVSASAAGSTAVGLPGSGTHLMASQLFHGAPLNFGLGAMFGGAELSIMDRWDPKAALERFSRGPTSSILVPTMMRQLLDLPAEVRDGLDPGNVTAILHGGEACPESLKRAMIGWVGPVLTEYYGFTEGGFSHCTSADWLDRPGTVGRPPEHLQVLVTDDDGNELSAGQVGTVWFRRADGRAFRYRNAPDKTDAAHRDDDAFTVGDVGWVDPDGYLFLAGRSAEVIVSAGVNVYPAEIEAVLSTVTGVRDICVVAGPDPERGERPVAFVELHAGHSTATVIEALEAASAERLAGYKRPRAWITDTPIQRDPTGKLLRLHHRSSLWPDTP